MLPVSSVPAMFATCISKLPAGFVALKFDTIVAVDTAEKTG